MSGSGILMQTAPRVSRFSYATRKAVVLGLRRLRAKEAAQAAAIRRRADALATVCP